MNTPYAFHPERIVTWTLDNGLRVIAEPLPFIATVSVGVFVHTGSMMESPDEEGLAHFMEHMAFKGTESRSNLQIALETDLLGGRLNAYTSKDHTCYHNKVISEDLSKTLDLIGDLILHPALYEEEMIKERSVICEEIAMDEDDPESLVAEYMVRAQYAGTPMEHPILGSREQVSAYLPADLMRFRETHYTPDRCVIAVCGAYDEQELRDTIQRVFGAWSGTSALDPLPSLTALDGQKVLLDRDTEQTHLCLGYPGFAYGKKENLTLDLLSAILGSSASARLFQRIREELGMAYTVYSYNAPVEGSGQFCLYAASSPENALNVLKEMDREMKRLARDGITQEELEQSRKMMRIGYLMGLESPGNRMMPMGHSLMLRNTRYSPETALARMEKITCEEIVDLAQSLCTHTPSLTAIGRDVQRLEVAYE